MRYCHDPAGKVFHGTVFAPDETFRDRRGRLAPARPPRGCSFRPPCPLKRADDGRATLDETAGIERIGRLGRGTV